MPYILTYTENTDYLHFIFSGNFKTGDVSNIWHEVHSCLCTHQDEKILIEEKPGSTAETLDTLEIYETAKFLATEKLEHPIKVALLYSDDVSAKTLKQARFGETVAINRGFRLRVFINRADALAWLCKD